MIWFQRPRLLHLPPPGYLLGHASWPRGSDGLVGGKVVTTPLGVEEAIVCLNALDWGLPPIFTA